jgi:putative tryptophan/tyrosine transport system substrate-binding protein
MRRREFIQLLGGAAGITWPRGGLAQNPSRRPLVAFLAGVSSESGSSLAALFGQHLQELLGPVAGRDFEIVYRYAGGDLARVPVLADELIRLKPDVLVASNTPAAMALREATAIIPIVAASVTDPVALGLVATHAQPGGNVTGILTTVDTLPEKQLALVTEVVPGAAKIGMLLHAGNQTQAIQRKGVEAAATALAIKLVPVEMELPDDLDIAFEAMARERFDGVIVLQALMFLNERRRIATLAIETRLPTMFGFREHVEDGGLMSYGTDQRASFRRAAEFVEKILKGAKPGDLPLELPTKFELVINVKTAKAIGLTIPESFLARADEVIE